MKKRRASTRLDAPVSDQLRSVIRARGMTPYAVATAADVAPSILTRFVNGDRGLSLDTFDRVAAALGLRLVESGRRGPVRGRNGTASGRGRGGGPAAFEAPETVAAAERPGAAGDDES